MIRHVLINGPWHDWEQIPVEWRRYTVCVWHSCTGRMQVIEAFASPDNLCKLRKRVALFKQSGPVRC